MENREYNDLGSIAIAARPIAIMASLTAARIKGVAALGASLSEAAAKKIGHISPAQGVDVSLHDGMVELTVRLIVQYGCRIPDVAIQVQKAIKDAVEEQTGYDVTAVHIMIQDISFQEEQGTGTETEVHDGDRSK